MCHIQLSHKPSKCSPAQIRRLASQVDGTRLWETHLRPILIERLPGTRGSLAVQQVCMNIQSFYIIAQCLWVSSRIHPLCSAPAHHLHTVFAVRWLGRRLGLLPLFNASWPSHVHQHHCHSGPFSPSQAAPGLPLWLQGSASRPPDPGEGFSWGQWFSGALCHDAGACHLSGCPA